MAKTVERQVGGDISRLVGSADPVCLGGSLSARPLTDMDVVRLYAFFDREGIKPVFVDNHDAPTRQEGRVYVVCDVTVIIKSPQRYVLLYGKPEEVEALARYLTAPERLRDESKILSLRRV